MSPLLLFIYYIFLSWFF